MSLESVPVTIRKAGFIGLLGRPNVGKSTLLNAILGEKLAIVAPKPQTTRNRLLGVRSFHDIQMAFVDTPGLHRSAGHSLLSRFMAQESMQVAGDVDVVVLVVELEKNEESPSTLDKNDRFLLEQISENTPSILVLNKVDRLRDRAQLLPLIERWQAAHTFAAIIPLSAKTGDGVPRLIEEIGKILPESEALFPDDTLTDRSERFLVTERIREQAFLLLHQEIPYAVAITIDDWQEELHPDGNRKKLRVDATLHVEKDSQKKIIVGHRGSMIREIGMRAREELRELLGCPVQLFLFVRIDEEWSQTVHGLREMGYEK